MYILILILLIFLIINNCIHYDYFTIGNISISKKINLDTSMCKTCRDHMKNISNNLDIDVEPCINKNDISLSGYDVKKYKKIVTEKEFKNGACCCTDKTNCSYSTLNRPEYYCIDFESLNLDNDVCKTNSKYDGYDSEFSYNFKTIDQYLEGKCCKTYETCRDHMKNISNNLDIDVEPCINKNDISLSGYDVKKYKKIVTEKEFKNGACCCTDKTNCSYSTLNRPEYYCIDFESLNLDNDVCKTNSKYDGYDSEFSYNFKTIDQYLEGKCCKTI